MSAFPPLADVERARSKSLLSATFRPSSVRTALLPVRAGTQAKRRRSDHPVGKHRVSHLLEACNFGAPYIVDVLAAARRASVFDAGIVDALHDVGQQLLQLHFLPRDAGRVLTHIEAGDGDAAGVRRLAGREQDLGGLEDIYAGPRVINTHSD